MNMKVTKEVIIQNVHSELVLTANILQNTQSESPATIRVTQDIYEKNRSGQRFKQIFCNLHFKRNFPGSSWWILETGQVFCLLENNDGSVVFKLDDHNCLTVLDGKLIMQEENKDKESLLIFIHFLIACWEVLNEIFFH